MTQNEGKGLRRDARDNIAKLQTAALEVFLAEGLGAPLETIARRAGVSVGTLYNHFGSREGLIDEVVPEVAGARLRDLAEAVLSLTSPRERLTAFVEGMIDLQVSDPALNDALLRRFPDATALTNVCERSTALGSELVKECHQEGTLSPDFTSEDLFALFWFAGTASHALNPPSSWRRVLQRSLQGSWL